MIGNTLSVLQATEHSKMCYNSVHKRNSKKTSVATVLDFSSSVSGLGQYLELTGSCGLSADTRN